MSAHAEADAEAERAEKKASVAFVCSSAHPLPDDDRLPWEQLRAAGVRCASVAWDDPSVEWASFDLVVLRSPWDYVERPAAFRRWVEDSVPRGRLCNPAEIVLWNADKAYLPGLAEEAGVPIPRSVFVPRGGDADAAVRRAAAWGAPGGLVVKPCVSNSARGAARFGAGAEDEAARHLVSLGGDAIVQEFVEGVRGGEFSMVYLGGRFSHCVRKVPAGGDYRTQEEHGARCVPAGAPPAGFREAADRVLAAAARRAGGAAARLLYARVDLVPGADGAPLLMELECVEPFLFVGLGGATASRLMAEGVLAALGAAVAAAAAHEP